MALLDAVKTLYKTMSGEREKEELLLLISEWSELLKACTTRIEGLEKGYDILRQGMFLKRELTIWKWVAAVSLIVALVSLGCVVYLLLKGR